MAIFLNSEPRSEKFFRFASRFTQWFPGLGAKALDGLFYPLLGNRFLEEATMGIYRRRAGRIPSFDRILVVADIHIGDAVLLQTSVSALRDLFPEARIDYMVKRSAACLLEGHPDVSNLWPVFTGSRLPNGSDGLTVREMAFEYDVVFNFCPFLKAGLFPEPERTFHFTARAPFFVRNEREGKDINHLSYQAHRFIHELLTPLYPLRRERAFEGPRMFLGRKARQEALAFLEKAGGADGPKVFLNLDTASPYTKIPQRFLEELLRGMLRWPCRVYLGEGHSDPGIGERLLQGVPLSEHSRITLVPKDLDLDSYAALLDHFDVFLSGDTGPLHMAAARKEPAEGGAPFRNQTTVLSVFGATPPRFSGYDSRKPGYLPSSQSVGARAFQSRSSCRNITCVHKMGKNCDAAGCFQSLDLEELLWGVRWGLKGKRT